MKTLVLLLGLLSLVSCGFETIDTGHRGVFTRYGKVDHENVLKEGFHTYNPFTYTLHELDIRTNKWEGEIQAYSKDSQTIVVKYAFNLAPREEVISKLYEKYGTGYIEKVVPYKVESRLKNVIGQHEAMEIVSKRAEITQAMNKYLAETLEPEGFFFSGLELSNLDFDDAFENAVREKVVATQNALKAENETARIREESKQKVIEAQAEAESMKIRSQALSQNKNLVEYEAVQKWNGVLPITMLGNSTPFINIGK